MSYDVQNIIRERAREKRKLLDSLKGERDRYVHFDEWTFYEHGVADPRLLPKPERRKLYVEYQQAMIEMHFLEWDCAKFWDLPSFINLFGR